MERILGVQETWILLLVTFVVTGSSLTLIDPNSLYSNDEIMLHARITKFRMISTLDDLNRDDGEPMRSFEVTKTDPITFINNGTSPEWRIFNATMTHRSTFAFEEIESFEKMSSIGVEDNMSIEIGNGIGDFSNETLIAALKVAYQFQYPYQLGNAWKGSWIANTSKSFTLSKAISVPPCSKYELQSSLFLLIEDIPLEFEMEVNVFAGDWDKRTPELLRILPPPGMEYLRDLGNSGVSTKVRGRIMASVGKKLEVYPQRISTIPGCNDRPTFLERFLSIFG